MASGLPYLMTCLSPHFKAGLLDAALVRSGPNHDPYFKFRKDWSAVAKDFDPKEKAQ